MLTSLSVDRPTRRRNGTAVVVVMVVVVLLTYACYRFVNRTQIEDIAASTRAEMAQLATCIESGEELVRAFLAGIRLSVTGSAEPMIIPVYFVPASSTKAKTLSTVAVFRSFRRGLKRTRWQDCDSDSPTSQISSAFPRCSIGIDDSQVRRGSHFCSFLVSNREPPMRCSIGLTPIRCRAKRVPRRKTTRRPSQAEPRRFRPMPFLGCSKNSCRFAA